MQRRKFLSNFLLTARAQAAPEILDMIKSFLITLGLFIFLFGQHCLAQSKINDNSKIKFWDIRKVLLTEYQVEQGFLDTACVNTIVLLKFKIINSRIDSVEFTKSAPIPIRQALSKALRLDRGGLTLIDGKKFENKTVIIPIQFGYLINCKDAAPIEIDNSGAIINLKKDQTSLVLAIREMLNFDSGDKASVDCIWLSAMSFSTLH